MDKSGPSYLHRRLIDLRYRPSTQLRRFRKHLIELDETINISSTKLYSFGYLAL